MFNYPVTAPEIWEYADTECELSDIYKELPGMYQQTENLHGFFFLSGKEHMVSERKRRYNYSCHKIKRAKRISNIFKYIPGVKMIAISNLIGSHNMRYNSDLDLLIVTSPERIWLTRFWCVAITSLLRMRPTPQKQRDKICLNFFLSEDRLDVSDMLIEDDVYFYYWMAGLLPVYDKDDTFSKFLEANFWVKQRFPNFGWGHNSTKGQIQNSPFFPLREMLEIILGRGEKMYKYIQLKFLSPELKELMNRDTRVVINDRMLKLHAHDRREEFKRKYFDSYW